MTSLAEFTERLRGAMVGAPPFEKTLKIDLTGDGVIRMEGNTVDNQDLPADCTVIVSREDLTAIAEGDLDPSDAFMSGRLRVDGDVGVAIAMQDVMGRAFG